MNGLTRDLLTGSTVELRRFFMVNPEWDTAGTVQIVETGVDESLIVFLARSVMRAPHDSKRLTANARVLVENGADVNQPDSNGVNAGTVVIHSALDFGFLRPRILPFVEFLCEQGADMTVPPKNGYGDTLPGGLDAMEKVQEFCKTHKTRAARDVASLLASSKNPLPRLPEGVPDTVGEMLSGETGTLKQQMAKLKPKGGRRTMRRRKRRSTRKYRR